MKYHFSYAMLLEEAAQWSFGGRYVDIPQASTVLRRSWVDKVQADIEKDLGGIASRVVMLHWTPVLPEVPDAD